MKNTLKIKQIVSRCILALFLSASAGFFFWGMWAGEDHLRDATKIWLVSGILSVLLACAFFATPEKRLNFSIALVASLLTLFFINFGLAIVHLKLGEIGGKMKGIEVDTRNKFQFYVDQRKKDPDIVLSPSIKQLYQDYGKEGRTEELDGLTPLSGVSNTQTILCNENGPYVVYRSDHYGFNNNPLVYDRANTKLLIIGDSFVLGSCVEQGEDLTSKISEGGFKAINIAMGGTGPLIQLGALREYGSHSNPKVVLSAFYENDLEELWGEYKVPLLRQYLNENFSQGLISRQKEVDSFWRQRIKSKEDHIRETINRKGVFASREQNKRILNLYFVRKLLGLIPRGYNLNQALELYRSILEATKYEAKKIGAKFYLVYLPSYKDVQSGLQDNAQKVFVIAKDLGIPVINFYDAVQEEEDPLKVFPFRLPGHYSPYGYALLAKVIIQDLFRNSPDVKSSK